MEYDKKIDDRAMILNCLDVDFARDRYENSYGYFTDNIQNYSNLNKCGYGKLITIGNSDIPYKGGNGKYFRFFLPESAVKKEKKYRPYTLQEFKGNLPKMIFLDDLIHFRNNVNGFEEYALKYNGYIIEDNTTFICLGSREYSLKNLFKNGEYLDKDGEWRPFGVEE